MTYLQKAVDIQGNPGHPYAYHSTGDCAVLARLGNGKIRILTLKLARILAEDVQVSRDVTLHFVEDVRAEVA